MRTTVIALSVVLALAASACAEGTSTQDPGSTIDHPTGSNDLILSVGWEGGFVPTEYLFTSAPSFALYGDGTVITPGAQIDLYPGPALPPFVARSVSEEGVQAVLRRALAAGLDTDGDYSDLGNMGIADAGTAAFFLSAEDGTHHVTAYALGMEGPERTDGQPEDMWRTRQQLRRFMDDLGTLDGWLPAGSLGEERPYEATAARVLVGPWAGDVDLPQDTVGWPLEAPLAGLGEPQPMLGDGWRCVVLEDQDWVLVQPMAAEANQLTPWIDEGSRSRLVFRPLLPHERGCPTP